ncbi:MAG: DNA repair protein RecN, partial [Eggerthellaceae bacterium]
LCGQHEHQHLLSAAYQRSLLDAWAGDEVASALVEYQNCFRAVEAYKKELQRLRDLESADSVELDRARFALEQIDDIDPQPSEYDDLLEQLPRLENAEMLMSESMSAQNALRDSHGVLEQIEGILTSLERMSKVDASINEDVNAVRDAYFSLE